jgi:hypothetical protein
VRCDNDDLVLGLPFDCHPRPPPSSPDHLLQAAKTRQPGQCYFRCSFPAAQLCRKAGGLACSQLIILQPRQVDKRTNSRANKSSPVLKCQSTLLYYLVL